MGQHSIKRTKPNNSDKQLQQRRQITFDPSQAVSRMVRNSTKEKSSEGEKIRKAQEVEKSKQVRVRPIIKHKFTQKELLMEGLDTEGENLKWLAEQKRNALAINNDKNNNNYSSNNSKSLKRWISRRGTNNVITFTEADDVPSILKLTPEDLPQKVSNKCVVTGTYAKYKDQLTGLLYANKEAFKVLRKHHAQGTLAELGKSLKA